ncbi:Qat anti-phage system TatD family nuclease QatD [Snodgrassella alvi]|uniref:Hydrolase TatD n=1 Tax=Snodgrassella alvi TaxID=1196083 RepID=A0A2N9X987_9NEIS|nr:Qat anti-phage system TatD family nuclease QatD [Snodgrassella alvi]PIT41409.1 hydrolase TatD [Snodgrassella alvi]
MIDFHCHLDLYTGPREVVETCRSKNIYVLSVTTCPKAWYGTYELSKHCPRIRTALGLHPQLAHLRYQELELFDFLLTNTRYIGEIGLDGGKGFKKHWAKQLKVFRHILKKSSLSGGKIMSIHSRLSTKYVLEELTQIEGIPILHWFTGTSNQLKKAIEMGCWFSINPTMLNTKKGYELISKIPKDRILTETDGPFGKIKNKILYPWDVSIAIEKLSIIWKCSPLDTECILKNNLKSILNSNL